MARISGIYSVETYLVLGFKFQTDLNSITRDKYLSWYPTQNHYWSPSGWREIHHFREKIKFWFSNFKGDKIGIFLHIRSHSEDLIIFILDRKKYHISCLYESIGQLKRNNQDILLNEKLVKIARSNIYLFKFKQSKNANIRNVYIPN